MASTLVVPRQSIEWKIPPMGWAKVSSDDTIVSATAKGAGCVVVRNSYGGVVAATV
jgi:hypothetical protein